MGREELVGYLAGAAARLVLVSAPAGSGKTTAVAQWRSSPAEIRAFAWLSVDARDNDPARFWWHVVHALQRACPELDVGEILAALRIQAPDIAGTFLPLLVNELARLEKPVVLVLDDYHVISDRGCHDQVAFLLPRLPAAVQLVLITRTDPPLPLARMRATGAAAARAEEALSTPACIGLIRMLASAILSLIVLNRSELAEAEKLARAACDILADAGPDLGTAPQSSLASTAAGAVLAHRGLPMRARREFEHALRIRRSQPGISPWATVEILIRLASVFADTGDQPGATALAEEAQLLLTSAPDGADTLSQELNVSQNTVKTHTSAIYRKLGVSARHDAIRRGRDMDIL